MSDTFMFYNYNSVRERILKPSFAPNANIVLPKIHMYVSRYSRLWPQNTLKHNPINDAEQQRALNAAVKVNSMF